MSRLSLYLRQYIPSISLLFKSFKLRSKEYLRENTLHGFIYFINPYRPIWERGIWLICTIASLGGALAIIATQWQRFQSTPTFTDLDMETHDLSFVYPGIHLCMTSDHLIMKEIPEDLENIYKMYYNWNWKPLNHTDIKLSVALSKVFQRITPNCNSLLMNCSENGIRTNCTNLFTKRLTPVGICCKSSPKKFIRTERLPFISFILREKKIINLYVHDIDEPPSRHNAITYRLNRNVDIAFEMIITNSDEGLRVLSRKQRECIFIDENLSQRNCYIECLKNNIFHLCGCIPWFEMINNTGKECKLNQYSCISKYIKPNDCMKKCYLQCNRTDYIFSKLKNNDTTSIKVEIPNFQYKRQIIYGWLDLLVSFGGIMGLFLGYSILTTVELIYYFSLRFYCGAIIDNSKSNNTVKIHVAERKNPKFIEIKYYDYME